MRARMAADDMSAFAQFPDLCTVHEPRSSDPVCRDEKVSAPAAGLKFLRHAFVRTQLTVVERKENRRLSVPALETINRAHQSPVPTIVDTLHVPAKVRATEFVERPVSAKCSVRVIGHIVISKRNRLHGRALCSAEFCKRET